MGIPRSPSLPPSSRIKMSTGRFSIQSRRRRPPEVVSPLTPALTTWYGSPVSLILDWSFVGQASVGSTPYPAARLSPNTTMVRLVAVEPAQHATVARQNSSARSPNLGPQSEFGSRPITVCVSSIAHLKTEARAGCNRMNRYTGCSFVGKNWFATLWDSGTRDVPQRQGTQQGGLVGS